ncbi:hypothetical protein C8R44DRAFT_958185 [Mycena epipterygia]|nr:hypothetical protein C8R44DRAFT_958185 [Mycena epipterygia]
MPPMLASLLGVSARPLLLENVGTLQRARRRYTPEMRHYIDGRTGDTMWCNGGKLHTNHVKINHFGQSQSLCRQCNPRVMFCGTKGTARGYCWLMNTRSPTSIRSEIQLSLKVVKDWSLEAALLKTTVMAGRENKYVDGKTAYFKVLCFVVGPGV